MLSCNGVSSNKLTTIYNPVDLESIHQQGAIDLKLSLPSYYLLFLGRFGEVKNLPFMIDSFELVSREIPSLHLVLVGDGPMKPVLLQKVEALGISEKVHFLGVMPNPFPIVKSAAAVLLPSLSEALPTIILECFAFEKTVIATPTNGAIDLLENGKLGYISRTFDHVEEFAELIKEGLSCPISNELLINKIQAFNSIVKVKELEKLF
jgi:glycosyltransferase involved in cell wall biosynthesis